MARVLSGRSEWMPRAACRGMNLSAFFPEEGMNVSKEVADTCKSCPVLERCREWALRHETYGYFGGLSATERHKVRRQMKIALVAPHHLV